MSSVVNVKIHDHVKNNKVDATVNLDDVIAKVKEDLVDLIKVQAKDQQLIFAGKIMKDTETFRDNKIVDGSTVHMVPKLAARQQNARPAPATTNATPAAANTTTPPPQQQQQQGFGGNAFNNPFAGLGGMGRLNGQSMQQMRQQLMQNPEMMDQIMNSPLFQSLVNNPNMMQNMFQNNPQMQQILSENPELRHALNDPETQRQSMRMASNPALRREMMRNQDRALQNIEAHPEGFNHLRRMYENVQAPMMEASINAANANNPFANNVSPSVRQAQQEAQRQEAERGQGNSTSPNTQALPNPWGRPTAQRPSNPPANTNGAGGNNVNRNLGNLFGGGMGLGGGAANMDPNQVANMMENPMMQNMMNQIISDPNFLSNMEQSNPMIRQMFQQNPMIRQMMQNPAMMRQMMNPATIRASMQLRQAMQQQGGGQGAGATNTGMNANILNTLLGASGGGANPWANVGANGNNGQGGATTGNVQNQFLPNGGNPLLGNWHAFSQVVNNASGQNASSSSNPWAGNNVQGGGGSNQSPAERYAVQLEALRNMGFDDESANIRALQQTNGNINMAVERLISGNV